MLDVLHSNKNMIIQLLWIGLMAAAISVVGLGACDNEPTDGDADGDSDGDGDGDVDPGCNETCATSGDGECDDGGPDSLFSICDFGTDCTDCGVRNPDDCVPRCSDDEGNVYECGRDGCGGECGTCADGEACSWDRVCEICTPDCAERECGDDGCGGSCGECTAPEECTWEGQCEVCTPDCSDGEGGTLECGDDGCGGSCGECGDGEQCGWDGMCETCGCGDRECGYDPCDMETSCGECTGTDECNDGTCEPCQPSCEDGEGNVYTCGDDGCGGTCGTCGAGEFCNDTTRACETGDANCNDTCHNDVEDGWCDDGRYAEGECPEELSGCTSICLPGTDCTDCGPLS